MPKPVFLEDIMNAMENKYLASNVAAKRARQLNERSVIPEVSTDAIKETTIALEELLAGILYYQAPQAETPSTIEDLLKFEEPQPEEEVEEEEPLLEEEYVDDRDFTYTDDEPEEGI